MNLRIERGDFDREIQRRHRAARRHIAFARARPFRRLLCEQFHQLQVTPRVFVGFRLAHHRFAEHIQGERDVLFVQLPQRGDDFLLVVAEHELPRQAGDLRFHARAQQPRRARRGLERHA